jgi:hypothetical protein
VSGQITLLTSWEEKESALPGGGTLVQFSPGGEPHLAAILGAVVERWNDVLERPRPTEETLTALVGQKVTVVDHGENMLGGGVLGCCEGRLFQNSGGAFGIVPKGKRTKGLRVRPEKTLDVLDGWAAADAAEMVRRVRDGLPTLRPLTQERLLELPSSSNECSLAVFGRWSLEETQHDALYLVTNYLRGDDIIEGLLLIRPSVGFSETGSCWGRDLLRMGGEVVGYSPISIGEAIGLTDLPFEDAYERVLGNCVGAAA